MINKTEKIREEIKTHFDINSSLGFTKLISQSEYGLYYIETEHYKQSKSNSDWIISKIYVHHLENQKVIFEYLTNHDDDFHTWICKNGNDYLLFPEVQGGQSILDISEQKLYSFYSEDDPFIWVDIFISPDKTKLAVMGCYWACPTELVIYDCNDLTNLPYVPIYRQLLENNFEIEGWIDEKTIKITDKKSKKDKFISYNVN